MKKLAAVLLLLASLHARADIVIVEHMQMDSDSGQTNAQDITIKIKGDKARVDLGNGQVSTIMDVSTGDMITLIHGRSMFLKTSGDQAKAMMAQMKKMQGNTTEEPAAPKIVDTGKKEKVGDYNAEIYTAESADRKSTFWVTKDIPNYATLQEQMKKMQALQEKLGQKTVDISKIEGVPVKTQATASGKTITTTMVSVKETPVDDADLQPPSTYTEMQMPQAPSNAAPQPPQAQPEQKPQP